MTKDEVIEAVKTVLKQWENKEITDRHAIILVAMAINFGLDEEKK
jgi:hypothetical protein